MGDARERLLPGSSTTYVESEEKGFSKIEMLVSATGGLSLSQVCAVTGLEGSTIQNWVKRGWVKNPNGKKYDEVHIARILIINALKECIKLEHISLLLSYVAGSGNEGDTIKESELFNYLCDALEMLGQADDLSRGGVESVADAVVEDVENLELGLRIRKALTVMIYACVCTDVKRRTETMMGRVLKEIDNMNKKKEAEAPKPLVEAPPKDKSADDITKEFEELYNNATKAIEESLEEDKDDKETTKLPRISWPFRKGDG